MFNKFFTFFTYPPVVIAICVGFVVVVIMVGVVNFGDHSNYRYNDEEQAVIAQTVEDGDNGYRAYVNDTRIDSDYRPTWEDDVIVYEVTDGESASRTPTTYVREWTPWGNPDIRCVMNRKVGGIACFPTK